MSFEGRVAIVTGGTRGLGAAVSMRLLQEGAHVVAVYAGNAGAASAFAESIVDLPGVLTTHRAAR